MLQPIANEVNNVCGGLAYGRDIHCNSNDVERWYSAIANALLHASYECVPYTKANVYKQWWDDNLNTLKHNCMKSHQEWIDAGKPRFGPIFEKRNSDKRLYRDLIKARKFEAKQNVSDSLLQSLYNAKTNKFWGTWKNKVCDSNYVLPNIDGATNEETASELFKSYFDKIANSMDDKYNIDMSQKLKKLMSSRSLAYKSGNVKDLDCNAFNALLIDIGISKLHSGKAAGIDNLQNE